MTGEVTLRGRVLAIGGLKEKTMAAMRSGITTVFIPADNVKDLEEIDQTVRAALHFVPVEQVDQVLAEALNGGQKIAAGDLCHSAQIGQSSAGQGISDLRLGG
jgi:ATP-dependent Lon protease